MLSIALRALSSGVGLMPLYVQEWKALRGIMSFFNSPLPSSPQRKFPAGIIAQSNGWGMVNGKQ
jgi:hypothetical protein